MTTELTAQEIIAHCASRGVTCERAELDTGVWVLSLAPAPAAVLHRLGVELKAMGARWVTLEVNHER
ncbi:MAG: hypothetical protein R3E66_17400 [bacterium]